MGEQVYPAHREKLDKLITSIKFTPDDICGALYACLYGLATGHEALWYKVFTARELRGLE